MDVVQFLIVFGIICFPSVFSAYRKKYTCDGDLKLECAEGELVLVAMNTADRYDLTACPDPSGRYTLPNPKLKEAVWQKCSGKTKCTIETGFKMEDYRYLDVVYDCGTGYDLCGKQTIFANSSYLRSPNDFDFNSRKSCYCEAEMEEPAKLSIRVVEKRFNVTMPKLTITWLNKTETIKKLGLKNTAKKFKITFSANHQAGSGSFLLQYNADRPVTLVCNKEDKAKIELGTILIAPIAMVALLILITILFMIIKKIKKNKKQRLQVSELQTKTTDIESQPDKPDLLNYGATTEEHSNVKSDIPLEDQGQPSSKGE